jgi:hypothetical protein
MGERKIGLYVILFVAMLWSMGFSYTRWIDGDAGWKMGWAALLAVRVKSNWN